VVDAVGYENKELHEGFGIGAKKHASNKEKGDESSRIFLTCS
jgi:hypothetical protein